MSIISVLPKNISKLIAAGEVVERPSSVIKELVENSIDAGSKNVTVEIKRGGILYMSVRDDGCGILREDVPTAFMRHATSKIKDKYDLDNIIMLGFRGEALAAINAVSRVEIITRRPQDEVGTRFTIEGGEPGSLEEIGCDCGTLIVVRDIFYNTPARMKFLKSDVTEANSISAVIDRIALSHPDIAFKFIRDSKIVLKTFGDSNLNNTIYAVLGKDFAVSLIEATGESEGITVSGKICKPVFCRQNRNGQFFFLNGRLIRSGTACAALEQAYKNSVMTGKFPCCVLYINAPANSVDVNVHPTKTEVRFSDEHKIFSAVYYAVKNALVSADTRPEIKVKTPFNPYFANPEKPEQIRISKCTAPVGDIYTAHDIIAKQASAPMAKSDSWVQGEYYNVERLKESSAQQASVNIHSAVNDDAKVGIKESKTKLSESVVSRVSEPEKKEIRFVGQVFDTYIIAEYENEFYLIDKHAAHERILYEELKKSSKTAVQELLTPLSITLTKEEYSAIIQSTQQLQDIGFIVEDFGIGSVAVRAVPVILAKEDISLLISEIAEKIREGKLLSPDKVDDIFHTIACKAAIKGNRRTSNEEMAELADKVLNSDDIMYCPHGRPVAFKITRAELEKHFGRTK